jgi:hypothetical protein
MDLNLPRTRRHGADAMADKLTEAETRWDARLSSQESQALDVLRDAFRRIASEDSETTGR